MLRAALVFSLALLAGCRSAPEVPEMQPREAYQAVANELPRADFGWGTPSSLAELAASSRTDRPADLDRPPDLSCDERSMRVVVDVFRPRVFTIPYSAFVDVTYTYSLFPNLLFCVVFPFLQLSETRLVFDGTKVTGFFEHLKSECDRLDNISREVGMGGPYEHAENVRQKISDDAKDFGQGKVSLHFSYATPLPPWIPWTGRARHAAEALAWVKAHPNEPRAESH